MTCSALSEFFGNAGAVPDVGQEDVTDEVERVVGSNANRANEVDWQLRGTSTRSGLGRASAAVFVVATLGLLVVVGWQLDGVIRQNSVDVEITRQEVVQTGSGCQWEIDADVINGEDRDLVIFTGQLNGIDRSTKVLGGGVAAGATGSVTYVLPLESCSTDPASLDPAALMIAYRFRGSDDTNFVGAHPLADR